MRLHATTALLTALTLLTTGCQTAAGNVGADTKATESPEGQMVADIAAARQIARWGRDHKDALALTTAAAILKATPTGGQAPKADGDRSQGAADKAEKGPATAESLLAEARALAGQDQGMLAAIDRVSSDRARGRDGGPGYVRERVMARSKDIYHIVFRGGENARIVVDGDGDTDLDVFVYDENGNLITSDTDGTDYCIVSWTPRWRGPFRVEIHNLGQISNIYTLTTN